MKRTAVLFAALAGMFLAAHAQAQQPGSTYLGVGYGSIWSDGASPYGNTVDDGVAGGGRIYAGRMVDRFGVELGYYDLGKYNVTLAGAPVSKMVTKAIAVSGIYAAPLGGGYTFSTKIGIAFTRAENQCVQCGILNPPNVNTMKRGLSGLIGFGLAAQLSNNFGVRMDLEHFGAVHHAISTFDYKNAYDLFSVSAQISF